MSFELTPDQEKRRAAFRRLIDAHIVPHADAFDRDERIPDALFRTLGDAGCLLAAIPAEFGGGGMDALTHGLLAEEMGRGSGSTANLMTVASMVSHVLWRFGDDTQHKRWLPGLASGALVGAYALTEPDVGSDAARVTTTARREGDRYVLDGAKRWISFGHRADVYIVFAQCGGQPTAFIVERDAPGLSVEPITGLLGMRGSMLAGLRFDGCTIPAGNLLGREGIGFTWIGASSLDHGRYVTACGSVGIAQACLEASRSYARTREQFGVPIGKHQLVRQMLTDMIADTSAARLLCHRAAHLRDAAHPEAIQATLIAKYFASRAAVRSANDTVQLHGANGCGDTYPAQRLYRDAKIMEIIEGTTQIHQIKIAGLG